MRWTPGGMSSNIEDRRGEGGGGSGGFRFGGGGAKLGLGGLLVLAVLSFITKTDLITPFGGGAPAVSGEGNRVRDEARDQREQPAVQFVSFVLDDAQETWTRLFQSMGREYQHSRLVLFRDTIDSGCGFAQSATGPFYCPADGKVYIDLSFFEELKQRFGAPGDFAQAYVLAHEIGHHVQNLLGFERKVRSARQSNPSQANALSVRLELQADCFAGVWGHSTRQRKILEEGDIEEGLNAAAAIGDDRLTRGRVSPDSFTHGTSQQRASWLRRGLESGDPGACDTFGNSR